MLEGVDYTFNAKHALRPEAPVIRGTAQNPDVFFQGREACNPYYDKVEGIVQEEMDKFAKISGRQYHVVDYVGAADAEQVIVIMGSGAETVEETINYLNAEGAKLGVLKIHLYRPFPEKSFLKALPKSVKVVSVLDRTKESGSIGEPLYLDVVATLTQAFANGEIANMPKVVGGRYGLSSKEFTPGMVKAVFDNGFAAKSINGFSVGITDDVTHKSLAFDDSIDTEPKDVVRAVFYGLGADGTVGANKNSIKIIAEDAGKYGQGYFVYDSRKSGSMTTSHLRFSDNPIKSAYLINKADFVACHQFPFMNKVDILKIAKPGATFLLNAPYAAEEVWNHLPIEVQEEIIAKKLNFYSINAIEVARETGMGQRINTVMQTCFFAISNILPKDEAIAQIKNAIKKTYSKKGDAIVQKNFAAVDASLAHLHKVEYPSEVTSTFHRQAPVPANAPEFVKKLTAELIADRGDQLPVSAFGEVVDGTWPTGTTQYEKRCIATEIPVWDPAVCIQCGKCSLVCPHGVIRMKIASEEELKNAPAGFKSAAYKGKEFAGKQFIWQMSPEDCTGCGICVSACPAKNKADPSKKAINMDHIENHLEEQIACWNFFETLLNTYQYAEEHTPYVPAFVSPLINVSCFGHLRLLDKCNLTDDFKATGLTNMKLTDGLNHSHAVLRDAKVARYMWGETQPILRNIDALSEHFSQEKLAFTVCPIRYSIGAILFTRETWERFGKFPLTFVGGPYGLGDDEECICHYACFTGRAMIVSDNCLVGHLGYGGAQTASMLEYYAEHKDRFAFVDDSE